MIIVLKKTMSSLVKFKLAKTSCSSNPKLKDKNEPISDNYILYHPYHINRNVDSDKLRTSAYPFRVERETLYLLPY
jgi:hypothetical protein